MANVFRPFDAREGFVRGSAGWVTPLNAVAALAAAAATEIDLTTAETTHSTFAARIQAFRGTTGSIDAGARADVAVSFPVGLADTNVTVTATVLSTAAAGLGLVAERITSISNSAVNVQVYNASAGALTGTLHLISVHD